MTNAAHIEEKTSLQLSQIQQVITISSFVLEFQRQYNELQQLYGVRCSSYVGQSKISVRLWHYPIQTIYIQNSYLNDSCGTNPVRRFLVRARLHVHPCGSVPHFQNSQQNLTSARNRSVVHYKHIYTLTYCKSFALAKLVYLVNIDMQALWCIEGGKYIWKMNRVFNI